MTRLWVISSFLTGIFISSCFFIGLILGLEFSFSLASNYFIGLVAIISAATTIQSISAQIENNNEIEKNRMKRKSLQVRASLPLHLSDVWRNINAVLKWYELPAREIEFDIREMEQSIKSISEIIEFLPEQTGNSIANFVSAFQVLKTRLERKVQTFRRYSNNERVVESIIIDGNSLDAVLDWAIYRCMINHLFSFARGETASVNGFSVSARSIEDVLNWYYVSETVGQVPEVVEKAKARLHQRIENGRPISDFWQIHGVIFKVEKNHQM